MRACNSMNRPCLEIWSLSLYFVEYPYVDSVMVVCHLYDAFTNSHRLIFKLAALIITITTASSWLFWLITGTRSAGMWRHPPACIPSSIINLISHLLLSALSFFIKQGEATVEAGAGPCLCETKPFVIPVCRFHVGGNVKTEDQRRRHQRQNWDWEAFEVMHKVKTRAGQDAIARQCLEMFRVKGEAAAAVAVAAWWQETVPLRSACEPWSHFPAHVTGPENKWINTSHYTANPP